METGKRLIIALVTFIFLLAAPQIWGTDQGNTKYFTLDNGLQIFLQERDTIPLVNIAFGINVGIKDESPETSGIVHLLEHLVLLGGTDSYKSDELIKEARKRGFHFNAHTDHDLMTLEVSLPAEHLEFGLNFVKEKIFALKLRKDELEREKTIIIEEINQILDDPMRFGTYLVLENLFRGHAYGRPLFGDKQVVNNAAITQLAAFHKKFFTPANCSLSIIGNFKLEEVESKTRDIFGKVEKSAAPAANLSPCQPLKKKIEITEEMDIDQAYVILGLSAPPFNHEDYFSMGLLAHILGKGLNPLLNFALRGRRRVALRLSTRYLPLKYGGVFLVYIITKPGNIKTVEREIINLLKKTRTLRYSKEDFLEMNRSFVFDYLESAKNQFRFRSEEASEEGLHAAISYAQYMLLAAMDLSQKGGIEEIASSHLRNTAGKYLSGKKYAVVYLVPANDKK